jgi:DNA-binding NarL/FixJ family response regulator
MRVLITEARPSVTNALQLLLRHANWSVIGTAATPRQLLEKTKALRPDLIVLDWELDAKSPGARLVARLHGLDYRPLIVALSIDPESKQSALAAGADAFISKSDLPEQVLHVLETLNAAGTNNWAYH